MTSLHRVVITGLGVVAPNANDVPAFLQAIQQGTSGISKNPLYEELKFGCHVAGSPTFGRENMEGYLSEVTLYGLRSKNIMYAVKAAIDAWRDAGLRVHTPHPRTESGCVFGSSIADTEAMKNVIDKVLQKDARKLGSRIVEQTMNSGTTAYISGQLGLANRTLNNSAACATGTQSILMGFEYIKYGLAERMLVGSTEYVDPYIFGAFDSMRVLSRKYNDFPTKSSRPMSQTAAGFVPGSGAGALVIESLTSALARNAPIYAEILGGATNSGGQRSGGSMTSPSPEGVVRCIQEALKNSGIDGKAIDLVNGHLTATTADVMEIKNWVTALNRRGADFPMINSLKSMIGHCLSAAGSIESVASVLQLKHQFVHPNINLEDPHEGILSQIDIKMLPTTFIKRDLNTIAKANFGFGDVNSCIIFAKFAHENG